VGNDVPILLEPIHHNAFRLSGNHPYVQALRICEAFDTKFVLQQPIYRILSCSRITFDVLCRLWTHTARHYPGLQYFYPRHDNPAVAKIFAQFSLHVDLIDKSDVERLFSSAAQDNEWTVIEDVARRHNATSEAACFYAQFGRLLLLQTVTGVDARAVFCAACRGGQLLIMQHMMVLHGLSFNALRAGLVQMTTHGHLLATMYLVGISWILDYLTLL